MLWPLYPRGKSSLYYWIGGSVNPRADLDTVEERKIPALAGNKTPAFQPVARHYTDCNIPAQNNNNNNNNINNNL
jgi:hypothetical protein